MFRAVALTLCLALPLGARAGDAAKSGPRVDPGEEIDLVIDWLGVKTGEARIVMGQPQGPLWPIVCIARTSGVASIITLKERFTAMWDSAKGLSRGTELEAVEGGDAHLDTARFDREGKKAKVRFFRKHAREEKLLDVPDGTQDAASALLWIRLQPLTDASHLELPVFTNHDTFTLVADVVGRELLDTPAGRFQTLKLKVKTGFDREFAQKRDSFLWLSDDARHIPVKIESEFTVGSVTATLTGYKEGAMVAQGPAPELRTAP
jgi:hypothetical protein